MLCPLACLALLVGSCGSSEQSAVTPDPQTTTTTTSRSAAHRALLFFYDWEANVLTPEGKTVAPLLPGQDPVASRISQAAGDPSQGMALYDAALLASRQRAAASGAGASRSGPAYYLFDRDHQYLAGPEQRYGDLLSALGRSRLPAGSTVVTVPQGYVVLEAVAATANARVAISSPAARFYVLRDRVALTGKDIRDPQQGFNENQQPDVEFRFTDAGKTAFHNVTRAIAQRGTTLHLPGTDPRATLQHFAAVLDGRLISVASIDPQQLPDGIDGEGGAVIEGGFTIQSAQDLANLIKDEGRR